MGQLSSTESHSGLSLFAGNVLHRAQSVVNTLTLSYEEFLNILYEANKIGRTTKDASGKYSVFAVDKDTCATVMWRTTVRIGCVRVDAATNKIESYRILNLQQFLEVYRILASFVHTNPFHLEDQSNLSSQSGGTTSSQNAECTEPKQLFSTSVILDRVGAVERQPCDLEDCCICLEKQPEVMLPCGHAYCLPCIVEWKEGFSNKCPICRDNIDLGEEAWVIPPKPSTTEVEAEMQEALQGVSERVAEFGSTGETSRNGLKLMVPMKSYTGSQ